MLNQWSFKIFCDDALMYIMNPRNIEKKIELQNI